LRNSPFFRELIKGEILPNAKVVVTSRPSASTCLHQLIQRKESKFLDQQRTVCQWSSEGFSWQITNTKMTQQYPTIDTVCYIPINMAIIIALLPTTTEMFASFIQHTVCHHLKTISNIVENERINKMEDLPQPVQWVLQQLEKIAFDALEKDRIIFTVNDLPEMCKDGPTCYGLLKSVQ